MRNIRASESDLDWSSYYLGVLVSKIRHTCIIITNSFQQLTTVIWINASINALYRCQVFVEVRIHWFGRLFRPYPQTRRISFAKVTYVEHGGMHFRDDAYVECGVSRGKLQYRSSEISKAHAITGIQNRLENMECCHKLFLRKLQRIFQPFAVNNTEMLRSVRMVEADYWKGLVWLWWAVQKRSRGNR